MTHSNPTEQNSPKEQDISDRAYEIWQAEGRPEGRDLEIWLAAKREVGAKDSAPSVENKESASSVPEAVARPAWKNGGIRKSAPGNLGKKRFPVSQGKKSQPSA